MNVGSSGLKGGAREAVREAGDRAARRLGTRAGLAGMAAEAGMGIGRAIDEKTGVGRKIVDAVAGKAIDRVAAPEEERVKLRPEARQRLEDMTLEDLLIKKIMAEQPPRLLKATTEQKTIPRNSLLNYTMEQKTIPRKKSSSDNTPISNRKPYEEGEGEEAYAKGGSVGSASRRADGCAQRGKTRGKIV